MGSVVRQRVIKSWANSATRRFAEDGKNKFSGLDEEAAMDLLAALDAASSLSDEPAEVRRSSQAFERSRRAMGNDREWSLADLLSVQGW